MATSPSAPKAPRKRKARATPWVQPALTGAVPANDDALDAFLGPGTQRAPTQATTATTPNAKRVTGGRRARRSGVEFEQWMHGQLDAAVLVGRLAHYHPIWPEAGYERVADGKGGWRFELVWKADAHADVAGVLTDGRALVIECKSVEGGRLEKSAVEPQQQRHLDAVAKAGGLGGLALLAVEFRTEGRATRSLRRYVIPWTQVPWTKARTALSIEERDALPWCVVHGELFVLLRTPDRVWTFKQRVIALAAETEDMQVFRRRLAELGTA